MKEKEEYVICIYSHSIVCVLTPCATVNQEGDERRSHIGGNYLWRGDSHGFISHTRTHAYTHTHTLMHNHMVPGVQMYDYYYVCVCLCLLSYGSVPPTTQSRGLSEYSQHVGTAHSTAVCPWRPLPCLPVPSYLDRGQSSRPGKQYRARPWKTTAAPPCIRLRSPGTPGLVHWLRSQKRAVWRDY